MNERFMHDGSEPGDHVQADWLDDHGRHAEAEHLRQAIDAGPEGPDWCYEPRYPGGGVGGVVGGVGGSVGVGVGGSVGVGVG